MKAISIRQPWAWLICHAGKDIENRDWATHVRGPVLIHASKGMTRDEYEEGYETYVDAIWERFGGGPPLGLPELPAYEELQRGGIIGRATIVDCVTESRSPWFFGKFGFVLRDAKPLPFLPWRGQLGFFEVPAPADSSPGGQA